MRQQDGHEVLRDLDRVLRRSIDSALTAAELAAAAADLCAARQREVEPCLHYTRLGVALHDALVALHRAHAGTLSHADGDDD